MVGFFIVRVIEYALKVMNFCKIFLCNKLIILIVKFIVFFV